MEFQPRRGPKTDYGWRTSLIHRLFHGGHSRTFDNQFLPCKGQGGLQRKVQPRESHALRSGQRREVSKSFIPFTFGSYKPRREGQKSSHDRPPSSAIRDDKVRSSTTPRTTLKHLREILSLVFLCLRFNIPDEGTGIFPDRPWVRSLPGISNSLSRGALRRRPTRRRDLSGGRTVV